MISKKSSIMLVKTPLSSLGGTSKGLTCLPDVTLRYPLMGLTFCCKLSTPKVNFGKYFCYICYYIYSEFKDFNSLQLFRDCNLALILLQVVILVLTFAF